MLIEALDFNQPAIFSYRKTVYLDTKNESFLWVTFSTCSELQWLYFRPKYGLMNWSFVDKLGSLPDPDIFYIIDYFGYIGYLDVNRSAG